MQKSSVNNVLITNVEALVNNNGNDPVPAKNPEKKKLYMSVEKGKMFGYCGEITTGDPNFTLCSNWMRTDLDLEHDVCYEKLNN